MRANILLVSLALVCLFCSVVPAHAGEGFLVPFITISEEFNDNVFFSTQNEKSDFITHVAPGFKLDYESPFWRWRADAIVNYLHFSRGTMGDQLYPMVTVWGNMRPVGNFIYLDVYDSYTRVPLNWSDDSLYVNQADQNYLTVSPYLKFHPLKRLELTTGYIYRNMLYDRSDTVDWQEHDVFVRTAYQMTTRSDYFAQILYAYTTTSDNFNYNRLTASMGINYNYADRSHIYLEGGYSLLDTGGRNFSSPYWKVGINYYFGRTVASLDGEVVYNTDPRFNMTERRGIRGELKREFPRGTIGVSPYYYSTKDYVSDSIIETVYGITVLGTYDFSDRLKGHLGMTVGKEDCDGACIYPFYINWPNSSYDLITLDSGVNYAWKSDLTLFFSYIYSHRSYEVEGPANCNRVIVGLTKTFPGWKF